MVFTIGGRVSPARPHEACLAEITSLLFYLSNTKLAQLGHGSNIISHILYFLTLNQNVYVYLVS